MERTTGAPHIEFWFDFGSNYSYLTTQRIDALAARHGVQVLYKPFLLAPIFKRFGWSSSPFVLQKEKGDYVWRDMERQCAKYGLPWKRPSHFPRRALLPSRVALWGASAPWISQFCKRIMQLNFVEDRDIDDPALVSEVLLSLGLAEYIVGAALAEANKLAMHARSDEAARRKIFGAPTLFVGDEMFWGDDRLDDAIAFAVLKTV